MIELSNSIAQTIQPGQSLTFNNVLLHTGCGECHRPGSGAVGLRANDGIYECSFGANITSDTADATVQLALQMAGSPLFETTMKSTPSVANGFNSVSCSTFVSTCCRNGGGGSITVTNTGTTPVIVDINPCLKVKRVA